MEQVLSGRLALSRAIILGLLLALAAAAWALLAWQAAGSETDMVMASPTKLENVVRATSWRGVKRSPHCFNP